MEIFILEFYNFTLKYIDFWKKSDRTLIFNGYVYILYRYKTELKKPMFFLLLIW